MLRLVMMKATSENASLEMLTAEPDADLAAFVRHTRALVDATLEQLLPPESVSPERVHAAIRWSVFAGGKRFRPLLTLAVGEAFGVAPGLLINTACALELIHTYSLIHDDLPAMDNDDLRRGRATCHVRFGEATAILAGDALQTLAFKTIADDEQLPAALRVRLIAELAGASGTPVGMVAGQALDLEAESRAVSAPELEKIHGLKTGALIIAAARAGAIIAESSELELATITGYAAQLGLLFQITDDLLDVTANAETLGKTPGKDKRSEKATYPALYGVAATRKHRNVAHQNACDALAPLNRPTARLHAIADFIRQRQA
jgi:geranylgeranyl diphosphate synthase, type II